MQTITITSEKDRRYTAFIDSKAIGTLVYPKWYVYDADIVIGGNTYTLKGKGFWKTTYEVMQESKPVFTIETKWRGTQIARAKEPHHFYMLGPKGWFKSGYVLQSYKGEQVMEIQNDWSWKKWSSGYTVTLSNKISNDEDILLALIVTHCYRAALAAAATGTTVAS